VPRFVGSERNRDGDGAWSDGQGQRQGIKRLFQDVIGAHSLVHLAAVAARTGIAAG